MITKDQVERIAHLARLTLSPREKDCLPKELSRIVDYFEQISELDLADIQPTAHAVDVENVFRRDDEVVRTSIIEEVLENAPEKDDHFFVVPKVL